MATRQVLHAIAICGACISAWFSPAGATAGEIIVGTANSAQIHYNVGRAICRQYQRSLADSDCEVLRIEGRDAEEPLAVLTNVRNGTIEVGIVPSDWQHFSVNRSGPVEFMDIEFSNLRALFSLHGEPFTLVVRSDAGITQVQLADLLDETQSFVSKVERGEIRIDVIQLRTIAQALGTDLPHVVSVLESKLRRTKRKPRA